jgi:NAD(P)-dependent dehydrogenase (short-subunit alcohol dehydrogenase family)
MTITEHTFTWIITGATRGFGRSITESALQRGDDVVAAVRRPDAMSTLTERYPSQLLVFEFDARDVEGVPAVIAAATERFGHIDVLVNNAGRGFVGAAEEITDAELRESLALHLFVPAALTRAVLPVMRTQTHGTIMQMSSQGGRMAFAGVGTYCAGKFALEGWSEALAAEVAPFGVRVMIVEPSRFRTSFHAADVLAVAEVSDSYRSGILGTVRADMRGADGIQEGDPDRAAAIIVDLAHAEEVPLRLPLGTEAVQRIGDAYRRNLAALDEWAEIARSADYPDAVPSARPI